MSEGKDPERKKNKKKNKEKRRKERQENQEKQVEELKDESVNLPGELKSVDEIEALICHHRKLYHNEEPNISDDDFDHLFTLLRVMAPNHPLLNREQEDQEKQEAQLNRIETPTQTAELRPIEDPEEECLDDDLETELAVEYVNLLHMFMGVKLLREGAVLPTQATEKSAGFDVYAAEDAHVQCGRVTLVKTALHLVIPGGYRVSVRPRSGLSFKEGVTVVNSPGTIDEDYPGELFVALTKLTWGEGGPMGQNAFYEVKKGDRVAQICLEKVESVILLDTDESTQQTDRKSGLGSTGR